MVILSLAMLTIFFSAGKMTEVTDSELDYKKKQFEIAARLRRAILLTLITSSFTKLKANEDTVGFERHGIKHFVISSMSPFVALSKALSERMMAPQTSVVPTKESTFPLSSTPWNSFFRSSMMFDTFGGFLI